MLRVLIMFAILMTVGCGPLNTPMVQRVDDETQQEIDEGWNRALKPVDQLDRQQWLDIFVVAQAYQMGVDKLSLRSEKSFDGGSVVMEIQYDRQLPDKDSFVVTVRDNDGHTIRQENYARKDVEDTYSYFFSNKVPSDEAEREKFEAEMQKRAEVIARFFPGSDDEADQVEPGKDAQDNGG